MKKYFKYFLVCFFIVNILMILLSAIVYRNSDVRLPYLKLELGGLLISIILGISIFLFRLEKGNSIFNIVLGYLSIIPALLVLRGVFGTYLFRSASLLYIIMIIIGVIYLIVVFIVSKRYKQEVDHLNSLLEEKNRKTEEQ